jgi:hypothetical protein
MLTILFIVGRTTLFTPVDINLEQVVHFLNFYACKDQITGQRLRHLTLYNFMLWKHYSLSVNIPQTPGDPIGAILTSERATYY